MITSKVNEDQRRQMIAEAAYFRAERRGFSGGDPAMDWIEAEAEVDARVREIEGAHLLACLEEGLTTAQVDSARHLYRGLTDPTTGVQFYPGLERGSEAFWTTNGGFGDSVGGVGTIGSVVGAPAVGGAIVYSGCFLCVRGAWMATGSRRNVEVASSTGTTSSGVEVLKRS